MSFLLDTNAVSEWGQAAAESGSLVGWNPPKKIEFSSLSFRWQNCTAEWNVWRRDAVEAGLSRGCNMLQDLKTEFLPSMLMGRKPGAEQCHAVRPQDVRSGRWLLWRSRRRSTS
jgi:hypothetical protein